MNDKRDAETDLLIDIQKIIGANEPYEAVTLARYIESREAEIRRQIADELTNTHQGNCYVDRDGSCDWCDYIENLRGNK